LGRDGRYETIGMFETVSPAAGSGDATTNHETIRRWADRRDATPARAGPDADGALRFRFPDTDRFTPVSWDEFLEVFERERLALVYEPVDPDHADGEPVRENTFYKFVDRDSV
jgi:hypothetical protein